MKIINFWGNFVAMRFAGALSFSVVIQRSKALANKFSRLYYIIKFDIVKLFLKVFKAETIFFRVFRIFGT